MNVKGLIETVKGLPMEFEAGGKPRKLYPATLGSVMMQGPLYGRLGLTESGLGREGAGELLAGVRRDREAACMIIAISSGRGYGHASDGAGLRALAEEYGRDLGDEEIAEVLFAVMGMARAEEVMAESGIMEDLKLKGRVSEIKGGDGVSIGGRTVYGQLIGPVCRNYGWKPEEVVWDIPLTQLRLLLADEVSTVWLSDEERLRCGLYGGGVIDAGSASLGELMGM